MRRNIPLDFGTDDLEFERYTGRKPSAKEMRRWVMLLQSGVHSQLDWDCICNCAAECFKLEVEK